MFNNSYHSFKENITYKYCLKLRELKKNHIKTFKRFSQIVHPVSFLETKNKFLIMSLN